ncbi:MAG: beta-hydroxyacyl-ACP dehydratase [Planctomycetaceae bacterium]|nr:beta-hydroxyacyl-ACP dehydratase [Planctomycetaceae bacterium]
MRWFWIDRFVEFDSGSQAKAVKNVSLSEEHMHDHFPGFPVMPASLMLEGMAQTGGILLGEKNNFDHVVILAKVPKLTFHSWAEPGDTLTYEATLMDSRDEGGSTQVVAKVGERLVAEAEIVFVHLDHNDPELGAVDQKNFVFSTGLLSTMDVGAAGDGSK